MVSHQLGPVVLLPQPDDDGAAVVLGVDGAVDVDGVPRPGGDLAGETDLVVSCCERFKIFIILSLLIFNWEKCYQTLAITYPVIKPGRRLSGRDIKISSQLSTRT